MADYKVEGINDYHRSVVNNLPKCLTCWARCICGGGCFYDNKSHTGDMRKPDTFYCNETRAAAETNIYILSWTAQAGNISRGFIRIWWMRSCLRLQLRQDANREHSDMPRRLFL
ncbi:MAG: SPASM domain-containing protein [Nitrospirae bacterium YQR-1]